MHTWIISSTGADNYGTSVTEDITKLLASKEFEKIFPGHPLYGTSTSYLETEIIDICKQINQIRETNYPEEDHKKIQAFYAQVSLSGKVSLIG